LQKIIYIYIQVKNYVYEQDAHRPACVVETNVTNAYSAYKFSRFNDGATF